MKKLLKTVFMLMILIFLTACNKKENNTSSSISSIVLDDTTADVHEKTSEAETTTVPGIIPNSVGITVIKGVKDINLPNVDITVRTDISEEEQGLGAAIEKSYYADEDAKKLGVSKILVVQLDSAGVNTPEKEIFSKINELLVTSTAVIL